MTVHQQIDTLPGFRRAVVTIGTFDGVHLGHRKIIAQMQKEAQSVDGETVIVSFHPHPRNVISGKKEGIQLLTTLAERITLLGQLGIDHLVVIPFTESFAAMDAESYIRRFLVEKFHPEVIIIGYDHRFGKDRSGDYHLLEKLAPEMKFRVREIDAQVLHETNISSTRIRAALREGEVRKASALLGYPFFFEGVVVHGDQRGRTIGFPTANLVCRDPEKILPGNGVYAVMARIVDGPWAGKEYRGMMNIGLRPTVSGDSLRTEVNLFDFDGDIYGCTLRVSLIDYLRGEVRFPSLDALKAQLANDKRDAMQSLGQ